MVPHRHIPWWAGYGPGRTTPQRHRTLERDIRCRVNEWNKSPKPFIRTKTADEVLDTFAARLSRINDSGTD